MDIEEIIRKLSDPATVLEAMNHASNLPFTDKDSALFKQKRHKYHVGMSDYEKDSWRSEMMGFLSVYESKYGNYTADRLNRWHHLDRNVLKEKFKRLCRESNFPIKVLFFENNIKALSHRVHDILYSYHSVHYQSIKISSPKGNMNDDIIDFTNESTLQDDWTEFVQNIFGLNVPFIQIPNEFMKNGLHKQTHFVIQSVDKFCFEHFQAYYDFWALLNPEQSLFLFLHVPEKSLPKDLISPNFLVCYADQYECVEKLDFTRFFSTYDCYQEDLSLCNCERMTFNEAVEKLQFCEKNN